MKAYGCNARSFWWWLIAILSLENRQGKALIRHSLYRFRAEIRVHDQQAGVIPEINASFGGREAPQTNGTTSYLEKLSFERSSSTYDDKKLVIVHKDALEESSLNDMIQILRKDSEYKAVHLAEVLRNIASAILPEGVSREDEVKTHWIPGTQADFVMAYNIDELEKLSRGDLCTLMMAMGSCRCPLRDVVHIVRALRLARRLSSKLLYMGITNAISMKNPLAAYAMLREATQLSAVDFPPENKEDDSEASTEVADGYGELSDEMGMYRGYFKDGVKDGYGTYVFNNGEIFEGFFVDDEMHEGRFRSNCGSVYEGQIMQGKMHGKGIFKFSNGDLYKGDFCHSKRHGWGLFISTREGNVERYEGQFYQNKKHGTGTVYMSSPYRHVYHGEFFQNVMHGNGTVYFENGDVYVGQLENNCPHGYGTYYCNLPPACAPPGIDFAGLVQNSTAALGGDLVADQEADDLDDDEDGEEDEEAGAGAGVDQEEGNVASGGADGGDSNRGNREDRGRGLRGDLLIDTLGDWEGLAGRLEDRPGEREALRSNRTFLGAGNSYTYVGEWRENQREGLGRLETTFYPPDATSSTEPRVLTVYEGEWRSNREHGVGKLCTHDPQAGANSKPKLKQGVWKAGVFEREHKGFKRVEPVSASAPEGDASYADKLASDLGASLPQQQLHRGFGARPPQQGREKAPDEFVKQILQPQGKGIGGMDGSMLDGGEGEPSAAEVSMSTITDRAALMRALDSASRRRSGLEEESAALDEDSQQGQRQEAWSVSDEMLRSREGVIYIPRAAPSTKKSGEREPIERKIRLKLQAKNSSQEEEDQERLWNEGYGELEPPGKDLEGDVEIEYTPLIDITTIDELLDELAYVGEVDTAVELTESLVIRKLGEGVVPTLSTYSTVAVSAGRLGRPDVMLRVLRYAVLEQSRRGLILYSETLFVTALNICAISGDYHNALRVFDLYEGRYGVVQQKAYSLLLVSYISASHHEDPEIEDDVSSSNSSMEMGASLESKRKEKVLARSQNRGGSVGSSSTAQQEGPVVIRAPPKLFSLVEFLVSSNLDASNHALASLILNFKAMQGNVADASAYFARMSSPPQTQCPSSAALIAYADLLRTKKEWTLARELVVYMDSQGLIPYPRLKRYVESNNIGNAPLWSPSTGAGTSGPGGPNQGSKDGSEQADKGLGTTGEKSSNKLDSGVITITEPPPVNISGLPLSRTQMRRYHHYYASPVLGQFQDPLIVEAVARKTKQKVKEVTTVPDSVWKSALALQAGAGGGLAKARGDGGLLRLPSSTDLYILSARNSALSGVNEYLTRDTGEVEGLLDFLLDLVALQVTPGPVPASINLDLSNPLIYEDVTGIAQTLVWECDYLCCFANPGVWGKIVELTNSMAAVGFDLSGEGELGISTAADRGDLDLLFPRLPSRLLPGYSTARQSYLSREGQEDLEGGEDDDYDGGAEVAASSEARNKGEEDKPEPVVALANNAPRAALDKKTKILLRRRNIYMGMMSAALAHGNKYRLGSHQLDRKLVRLLHQIGNTGEEKGTEPLADATGSAVVEYSNYLHYGATANSINGGEIGKNNPQRARLLDAQTALQQVGEKSQPVIDTVLAILELMATEHDGLLLAMLDASFCQDMLSLLCRAGNAYGAMAGTPFKPMRATELREEQFPQFQHVFMMIINATIKHSDTGAVSASDSDALLKQMLVPFLAPCRFGAQPGFDNAIDTPSLLAFLERDYGLNRLSFPSQVHERVVDGLFRAGAPEAAKEYFDSIEPSKASPGSPPRAPLSAKVYETYINRLLREKDTTVALQVLKLLEEGPAAAPLPGPGSARGEGEGTDSLMSSLLRRDEADEPAAEDTDQLQALIDEQLEQEEVATVSTSSSSPEDTEETGKRSPGMRSPGLLTGSSLNPELRLMLNNLYGKVLNVYRATNRTKEARRLISLIRDKELVLDVTQAHSLMDIEIKAKNFVGALEIYDQFFPPAIEVPGSLLKLGDSQLTGHEASSDTQEDGTLLRRGGGITRECPELKAVVAMARALTRAVYPDSDHPGAQNDNDSSDAPDSDSRRLAEGAMGYILNVIHHFPGLTTQTRSLSSLYGVVGRLARLATEAGSLEATLALYTFIPLRDRRLSPWSIIAKQMADCATFSSPLSSPDVEASCLPHMRGRAELGLLLMRAEGQRGDQSGGMSPLSLINAVTAAPEQPASSLEADQSGHKSILYDPYLQFTPPMDDEISMNDPEATEVSGVVNIPPEVIGHAIKALVLPYPSAQHYSPSLREASSLRALALAPALLSSMRNKAQYPTWPLTLLFFAAGSAPRAAFEARSLHYQAHSTHQASLGVDVEQLGAENEYTTWVTASMACLTELDANLLVASVLADSTEEEEEEKRTYLKALQGAMKHARFRIHSSISKTLQSWGSDSDDYTGLEGTDEALLREQAVDSGGGLTLVGDALFVGLTGEDKVTYEEAKNGKPSRVLVNLYGERIAADVVAKFQRSVAEMEEHGAVMLQVLSSSSPQSDRCDNDAVDDRLTPWTLARLHAIEREVARLQEIDFEPEVLYPGIFVPAEQTDGSRPVLTSAPAQNEITSGAMSRSTVSKGANLGNLARNLRGQQRRRVLRTVRRKQSDRGWGTE